ncbi:MAG: proline dehydrogenase family protein [Gemmatimonadota bacterium]|nr:proline dehydrogenase family protein [Gemmatimonadota bacterium]MDH3479879.1 proline dehydrogenase family protein [Gemmatimonadota bacterium]MDH5550152.1 proline dehydrogenase family protein [Gemmatimonadota bacterium]
MRTLLLKGSQNQWLGTRVPKRKFVQRAVRRFMPGETLDAALATAEQLRELGMSTVVTLLGEAITDRAEAERMTTHYLDAYERIRRPGLPTEISVKPSQMGLDVGKDVCAAQLQALAARADASGSFLWIDMEATPYVDATLELFRDLRSRQTNVGVCLQSYLYRTAEDLEQLLPLAPAIRLVKGAYSEPPNLAFPRKRDVDENFMRLAKRMLSAEARDLGVRAGFGTHDMQLIDRIRDFAEGAGIPKDAYEVQMLYGIRRNEQIRLTAEGQSVRVLVSYGSAWFPWYMRRLAERPANLWFVVRSMVSA